MEIRLYEFPRFVDQAFPDQAGHGFEDARPADTDGNGVVDSPHLSPAPLDADAADGPGNTARPPGQLAPFQGRTGRSRCNEALVLIAQDHFPIRPEIDEEADVI